MRVLTLANVAQAKEVQSARKPALPDLNEEVAGQTSYWQFDLNQEPCDDEDVNRECYGGEQSHPPQVAVKNEEVDIVYQNKDWNTNEIFISVEELMAWVKSRALDNGYVVVTGRSKKKKGTDEVNKIWLVCDRGGEHNSTAILRLNQNVIYEHDYEFVKIRLTHPIHEIHEYRRCVSQSERHDQEFVMSVPCSEGCLRYILLLYSKLMIANPFRSPRRSSRELPASGQLPVGGLLTSGHTP
ncbi:hypothetical protein E3N88_19554 [Mikania micrantha]|uniref:Uncharacterized protein n=1 Tax=Mikania micrantha TaxID=192012 RepID=A0A5N6NRA8_9ASTR|nr:hypothetical protein E3N88_19554 [Mikania micrantha]